MFTAQRLHDLNQPLQAEHQLQFQYLADLLSRRNQDAQEVVRELVKFQVAIPSWALGTGGTRFGRYPLGGEPRNLEEKLGDVGLLHQLNGSSNSISLHIPWDIPQDIAGLEQLQQEYGLVIDSVNSNTFQDQKDQAFSYKFGSLSHTEPAVRQQAIQHNIDCINYGRQLGARTLTVWLADGSNFPGQQHLRRAYLRTQESLAAIYEAMPSDWQMLIEYKPYEPHFYSMVIPDWGTSYSLCQSLGKNANVLVDLGHHLPNTNIEQIVGRLQQFGRLGGFHFNGSMYGDDDLTTGSIKPFQLFLIFNELVDAARDTSVTNPLVAYMIDASHNTKDPLEDLLQSVENILGAYAKALLVDREALHEAQETNDVARAEELLRDAFLLDVRPLVAEAYRQSGGALKPVQAYRAAGVREQLIQQRGKRSVSTGL
ncbi:TIM barrel protein [Hymenobacter chitinivorans]|uniref:L-rhamnose isomerase/sugar isomerase n=1 Tax=Hymenobacter chitinivorans DSM 11115 TaxID=1121954 RepID=A0A2M9BPS4_9BACT|nr:TIM barrel protein [Hymenobacter chitinivorans]PJJ59933.1 L-rhamnose isomerase/sugar isomerase [Hymenobacter chitinivorans DSM 11115]